MATAINAGGRRRLEVSLFAGGGRRRRVMGRLAQSRFRSNLVVKRAGRFRFDGYVEAGRKPAPRQDELLVNLAVGHRFPRIVYDCWWTPAEESSAEGLDEQRMSWEGGSTGRSGRT